MLGRCKLLGIAGAAALVAGMFLFISGKEFTTNWVRWVFGPLLWFAGCALIICWALKATYSAGEMESRREDLGLPEEEKTRAAKKAS